MFATQTKAKVEIRSAKGFHDRFIIVDQQMCFQSGASFKDGGRTSPTTISQIIDAFQPSCRPTNRFGLPLPPLSRRFPHPRRAVVSRHSDPQGIDNLRQRRRLRNHPQWLRSDHALDGQANTGCDRGHAECSAKATAESRGQVNKGEADRTKKGDACSRDADGAASRSGF